jgi:hypothetical protein
MFLAAVAACLSGTAWAGEGPAAAAAPAAAEIDAIEIQRVMESVWEEVLANGVDDAVGKAGPGAGAVLQADAQDAAAAEPKAKS